ncbi:hypothetical protein [Paraburkholderia xenovorans]
MSIANKIVVTLIGALVSLPTIALSQQASDDDALKASVLVAVAQSLGADPSNLPEYQADLQAARRVADTASICGSGSGGQFLTPDIANKVISKAVDLVKQKNASFWERPHYVRDLIVVSAVSFEAGRLAGTSKEYRAALAASAPTPSNCKLAAQ